MAKAIICSAAEIDYTESLLWYAQRNANAANAFDAEFVDTLTEITSAPIATRFATNDISFV